MSAPKRTKKFSKKLLPLLTFAFSILVILAGLVLRYRADPIFQDYEPEKLVSEETSRPILISFPKESFSLSVLPTRIVEGNWELHDATANYLVSSRSPGTGGNVIIYGHNTKDVFGLLHRLKVSDPIIIKNNLDQEYSYAVSEITTVKPDQIEVLAPTDHEVLTLYTCTGFLDQKRLIIKALPTN